MNDFKQIFDRAPAPYMVVDRELRFVTANRAYLHVTASRLESLVGRSLFEVFPDDPADPNRQGALMLRASLERVLATGEPDTLALIPYKVPSHTAEGVILQDRYWSATHTPLFDAHGEVAWVLQHTEDVTELHGLRLAAQGNSTGAGGGRTPPQGDERLESRVLARAERAQQEKYVLEREYRHLRQLFEQAPGFVCILDGPDYVFDIANAAYRELAGSQDILGKRLGEALPEVAEQGFIKLLDRVRATGVPYVGMAERVVLQRDVGPVEFYLDFVYQPIHEPDGGVSGIFVLGHDVTARVQAHAELIRHRERLEELVQDRTRDLAETEAALRHAQKMEAVGRLTGGVAHDFNNLLQVIAGNLEMLERDQAEGSPGQRRVRNAIAAVDRGAKLASQLLAFARRQPLRPRVLELPRLMRGMDDMLRRALGEGIVLDIDAGAGLWRTFADPAQMENALLNLAINARDAMGGEGRLDLSACNVRVAADAPVPGGPAEAGDFVRVSVADTGSGMSAEVSSQAFEPFFTTKPEGHGSGLGLSMVYGFVRQSGGHVAIDSAPGRGATIHLYLPRCEALPVAEEPVPAPPAVGGSECVLVVEDDAQVRATVVELLVELGYRVLEAADGEAALDILAGPAGIDLLFTDVVMPGPVKSLELATRARELSPGIAVLFTSGYPRDAIVHDGRLDAGVTLLSKPYGRDDLAGIIRGLLGTAGEPS